MKKTIAVLVCCLVAFAAWYCLSFNRIKVRNAKTAGHNIICFGDSLTFETGATEGMDYPSQLSKTIGREVINAGVPGDTTSLALARLERDILSVSPKIVMITLGGNDLKNGVPKDVAFRNLKIIVESIQANGALVVIGGVDIPLWGRGYGDGYRELCRESGAVLTPNIFDGIMGKPKLMSDSIHPNDAGYTIMADRFYRAVKPFL
ncbi:MAG: arylesterase [Deltaproteobacteria bacterium]|nr:arylesterase [Deltaproteobacteria bacterium]